MVSVYWAAIVNVLQSSPGPLTRTRQGHARSPVGASWAISALIWYMPGKTGSQSRIRTSAGKPPILTMVSPTVRDRGFASPALGGEATVLQFFAMRTSQRGRTGAQRWLFLPTAVRSRPVQSVPRPRASCRSRGRVRKRVRRAWCGSGSGVASGPPVSESDDRTCLRLSKP